MQKISKALSIILTAFSPKQEDIELYRKELVLNTILALCLSLTFVLLLLLIASKTLNPSGISVLSFILFTSPFLLSYICSRKGQITIASWICIGAFSAGTWYAVHTWGFTLPAALLSLVLTTTITGILIGSRAGFIYAAISTILLSIDIYIMQINGYGPDLSWQSGQINWNDTIELSLFLLFVSGLTWLSNRQTELSLQRARSSEALLMIERDQLEVRVEQRTKELEQARIDQISEVYNFIEFGKLSAGLIHDLMSPLNALCLEFEQTKDIEPLQHSLHETLNHMRGASQKIQNIIAVSRRQIKFNLDREHISLWHLCQDIYTLHNHRLLKHQIEWYNHIDPSITVHTCHTLLSHIITNLVSNAIDACLEKDIHNTTDTYIPARNMIHIRATNTSEHLTISVSDNGIGIPPEQIQKVFQPFYSTKNEGGCGYGLAISKHMTEKYFHGSLSCTSEPQWTTFIFHAPHIKI